MFLGMVVGAFVGLAVGNSVASRVHLRTSDLHWFITSMLVYSGILMSVSGAGDLAEDVGCLCIAAGTVMSIATVAVRRCVAGEPFCPSNCLHSKGDDDDKDNDYGSGSGGSGGGGGGGGGGGSRFEDLRFDAVDTAGGGSWGDWRRDRDDKDDEEEEGEEETAGGEGEKEGETREHRELMLGTRQPSGSASGSSTRSFSDG